MYEEILKELNSFKEYAKITLENIGITVDEGYVVGSGDSYAASIIAEGIHEGFKALDPYEAQFSIKPEKTYIIISVSGRTVENIKLAMKAREANAFVLAITANPNSPLAKKATNTVIIHYPKPSVLLPGTLSFMLSVVALYGILGIRINLDRVVSPKPLHLLSLKPMFIGTKPGYGVAYFSSLKYYEIFGSKARFERTEQFCHATLFSIRKGDEVVVYPWINDHKAKKIYEILRNHVRIILAERCEMYEKPLCQIIDFLYGLLKIISLRKIIKPYFIKNKVFLNISSKLIY